MIDGTPLSELFDSGGPDPRRDGFVDDRGLVATLTVIVGGIAAGCAVASINIPSPFLRVLVAITGISLTLLTVILAADLVGRIRTHRAYTRSEATHTTALLTARIAQRRAELERHLQRHGALLPLGVKDRAVLITLIDLIDEDEKRLRDMTAAPRG